MTLFTKSLGILRKVWWKNQNCLQKFDNKQTVGRIPSNKKRNLEDIEIRNYVTKCRKDAMQL